MFEYIWILLPLGLLIGWFAAKQDIGRKQKFLHYLSLRYFLEEEGERNPKEALMELPLNSEDEGFKFSLTLGDAFRRRGEIEKAINLHEYVFSNVEVRAEIKASALHSLAEDYMAAGLLDRAESSLRLLMDYPDYQEEALRKLVHLYKQQRDWLQAVSALERVQDSNKTVTVEIAHLYCELAEESLDEYDASFSWAEQALTYDSGCARASLIKAYISLRKGEYEKCLEYLNDIEVQQVALVPLIVPIVHQVSAHVGLRFFKSWLRRQLERPEPHFHLHLWQTHVYVLDESIEEGIEYLRCRLQEEPNLQGVLLLNHLLTTSKHDGFFELYSTVFNNIVDQYAKFRCEKCGFTSKILQWSCPSCNSWNTDKPVSDIIALQKTA